MTGRDKFNLTHGSILGITHDFFNVLSFRHQARHRQIKGAYFVGASAHPGTGVSGSSFWEELADRDDQVPIAIAGSRLCTETILSDLSMSLPSTYTEPPGPATSSSLDRLQPTPWLYTLERAFGFIFPYLVGAILSLAAVFVAVWMFDWPVPFGITHTQASPIVEQAFPTIKLESNSKPVLWAGVVTVFLVLGYINLSGTIDPKV